MKEEDKNPLIDLRRILKILLLLDVVFIFLYYFIINPPTPETVCYGCRPQPIVETILIYSPITLFLALVMVSIPLKSFLRTLLAGFFGFILILLLYVFLSFVSPSYSCPIGWCRFNSTGFTCIASKIQAGTSELYLRLGSSLKNDIKIVGAKCVAAVDVPTPLYIEPLNQSILIRSGTTATIVGEGANNTLYCKNGDGSIPSEARIGNKACLSIYINYTDTVTGQSNITKVSMSGLYEH
jgi:hypothetical protein